MSGSTQPQQSNATVKSPEPVPSSSQFRQSWRALCSVGNRQFFALNRDFYTDIVLQVGCGTSSRSFKAHKLILAIHSPVFEAMFFGLLAETSRVIKIPDIAPEAFEALLRFMYGDSITLESIPYAARCLVAADKYLVEDLKALLKRRISFLTCNEIQFWESFNNDDIFFMPEVKEKCLEYLRRNASAVLKSDNFYDVSPAFMESILLMENISVSESDLLESLVTWYLKRNPVNEKKNIFRQFLSHIRFSNMKLDEFITFIDKFPSVLEANESLLIVKHLSKSSYKLPDWCSKNTSVRRYKPVFNPQNPYFLNRFLAPDWDFATVSNRLTTRLTDT